ncbi:hypothetical protein GQR36_04845 [Enterococcus termitis]
MNSYDLEELEVTMIVDPNQIVIAKLQETVQNFARKHYYKRVLWIVDRNDSYLVDFIKQSGRYNYSFSECAMVFNNSIDLAPSNCLLEFAKKEDTTAISCLEDGSDHGEYKVIEAADLAKTLVFKKDGEIIASIRLEKVIRNAEFMVLSLDQICVEKALVEKLLPKSYTN